MKKLLIQILIWLNFCFYVPGQKIESAWDIISLKNWDSEFEQDEIKFSLDGSVQKTWFHQNSKSTLKPLIVSLLTWSGGYNQEDQLDNEILLPDRNYIHPDFRGANNNPNTCGSSLVIADNEDAIQFAINRGNVDTNNIHIIGLSEGGYTTMLAYMKINC